MAENDSQNSSSPCDRNPVSEKRKCDELEDTDSESDRESERKEQLTQKKHKFTFQMVKATTPAKVDLIDNSDEKRKNAGPICLKLGTQKQKETPNVIKTSASVAKAFNDEDEEAEEMPPEARMRMRNIGRDTPTSAGPNSFGKTRQGFCDTKKMFEKQIKKKMEDVSY